MNFFDSYYEAGIGLPDEKRQRYYTAIIDYYYTGVEPELNGELARLWALTKPNVDMSIRQRENGKNGGAPRKNETQKEPKQNPEKTQKEPKQNPEKTQTEPSPSISISLSSKEVIESKKDKRGTGGEGKEREEGGKHKYGEYDNVLLTDAERDKLMAEYPDDWQERINDLSSYIASKGNKYKSHYATIRNWARKDTQAARSGTQKKEEFDMGEYLRQMGGF